MSNPQDDEYQESTSIGSLVSARECWLSLVEQGHQALPREYTFTFACPNQWAADGLADYLQRTSRSAVAIVTPWVTLRVWDDWHVEGTTPRRLPSLASLEHLFSGLRHAATRHQSELVGLTS